MEMNDELDTHTKKRQIFGGEIETWKNNFQKMLKEVPSRAESRGMEKAIIAEIMGNKEEQHHV